MRAPVTGNVRCQYVMFRKVRVVCGVFCVSAIAVVLSYPLLGLAGAADAFLAPGFYLGQLVPEWLVPKWLSNCDAGPACGAFDVFIISFIFWWPLCCVVGCIYFLRRQGAKTGT